jgi:signal transduction histidine kinase
VTLQRKLLLGFSLMVLPTLLVGVEAIRTNALERGTLAELGQRLARSRTYAEVENAMFNQIQVIWRYLGGDPGAKREFPLTGQVVDYWLDRWTAGLPPDASRLADGIRGIEGQIRAVGDRVFTLYGAGHREAAYRTARQELVVRLQPALAEVNREIYRQAREFSVQRAFGEVAGIVEAERRVLWAIILFALIAGLVASWRISRSLARPINELQQAMAVVGAGDLDHVIQPRSRDEIGDLARAFAQMTENVRQSRADLVRLNAELAAKIAQLERAQAQLVQSEKLASIGQMAAGVAHGLRNPLASLRAAAQLARHRVESPGARDQLQAIVEQVDRLDLRIAHLLAFSRPAPFHPLRESVRALVDGTLASCAELLRERRVEVAVRLPEHLPAIRVDPMRLEQAMTEIVSNALDAMPEGGRLEIAAQPEGVAGMDGVTLELADSGGGIPAHILPSVCEPFFTTRAEGSGLGLAIAKRYIEETGGRLELASVLGRGTTVRIWLPLADADPTAAATPPAAPRLA